MIEWLLSDEGAQARKETIWHFVPIMSPDGVACGWHRTNAQGVDMNRSYYFGGAAKEQGHEPYIFQKDMEALMASECPLTTVWSMHVGGGSGARAGSDEYLDKTIGPLDKLAQLLRKGDPEYKYMERSLTDPNRGGSIKRPAGDKRPKDFKWDPSKSTGKGPQRGDTWSGGPWTQFRITAVLVECGASSTKKESMTTGEIIIKALSEYYKGERPPFPQ